MATPKVTGHREPRNLAAATQLCERFAEIEAEVGTIDGARNDLIAAANAEADGKLAPLLEEKAQLAGKLDAWWGKGGREAALEGQKKGARSVELGGCLVGERKERATLQIAGAEEDVVEMLRGLRWAKPFVRIKYSLDRAQVLKDIDGKHSVAFAELGLSKAEGKDQFYVKRAEQGQTRS